MEIMLKNKYLIFSQHVSFLGRPRICGAHLVLRIQPENQEQQSEKHRLLCLLNDAKSLLQYKVIPAQHSLLDLDSLDSLEPPHGNRSSSPTEEVDS